MSWFSFEVSKVVAYVQAEETKLNVSKVVSEVEAGVLPLVTEYLASNPNASEAAVQTYIDGKVNSLVAVALGALPLPAAEKLLFDPIAIAAADAAVNGLVSSEYAKLIAKV